MLSRVLSSPSSSSSFASRSSLQPLTHQPLLSNLPFNSAKTHRFLSCRNSSPISTILSQPSHITHNSSRIALLPFPLSLPFTSKTGSDENTSSESNLPGWNFHFGVASLPHPEKAYKGGEDAYFFRSKVSEENKENTKSQVLVAGVADGVGGWADSGVDPSLYARKLMAEAHAAAQHSHDPLVVLDAAYKKSQTVTGSSTACIVTFQDSELRAANLGDSGFMVIRNGKVVFRTKEQQHSFNFPFQLGTGSRDHPKHADLQRFQVQENDVVVIGSDGLFDNLFSDQIASIVAEVTKVKRDPTQIAAAIGQNAQTVAKSKTAKTPFAVNAASNGYLFSGGKLDDITVLVVVVHHNQKSRL